MRTKIIAAVVGLLLVVGASIVLPARPAEAHHYNPQSRYICTALGPDNYTITHSWPYDIRPGFVRGWCEAGFFGHNVQYFYEWNTSTGQSYLISGYQRCDHPGGIVCGWPPHN